MELTRRHFAKLLASAAGMLAVGAGHCRDALGNVRFVQALRGRFFPGRVRPLDPSSVRTRGRWRG